MSGSGREMSGSGLYLSVSGREILGSSRDALGCTGMHHVARPLKSSFLLVDVLLNDNMSIL